MYVLPKQTATRYEDYACKQGGEIDDCRRHLITTAIVCFDKLKGVINGPLKFLTARKILPLLDLLAKFKRVLACSCSPNFCVARKFAKQFCLFLLVLAKKSQFSACSRMLTKTIRHPLRTGPPGVLNKVLYWEALPRVPAPYHFITTFGIKRCPFSIPSIYKWYPFHLPS